MGLLINRAWSEYVISGVTSSSFHDLNPKSLKRLHVLLVRARKLRACYSGGLPHIFPTRWQFLLQRRKTWWSWSSSTLGWQEKPQVHSTLYTLHSTLYTLHYDPGVESSVPPPSSRLAASRSGEDPGIRVSDQVTANWQHGSLVFN